MKLFAVLFSFLMLAPIAHAQTPQEMEQAAKRFEEAEAAFRVQEYDRALEEYKAAYLLSKAPELIYNIGQCQRLLGKYEEAISSYKIFIRDVPSAPSRKNAERLIAELEEFLSSGVTKEGLEKAGKSFTEAEGLYQIQEYDKALAAYKESYLLSRRPEILYNIGQCHRQLKQYEEAIKSYNAFLKARPESEQTEQTKALIQQCEAKIVKPSIQPGPEKEDKRHLLFYGGAGAFGVAGFFVGGVSLAVANQAQTQSELVFPAQQIDADEVRRLSKRAVNLAHVSDVLLVLGVASGVAGFVIARKAKVEPVVSISPAGVRVAVSF